MDTLTKLKNEAEQFGLELISNGKDCRHKIYKFKSCNHIQEIQTGAVRSNSFKCHECLSNKLEYEAKRSNLEIISDGKNNHYKLYKCLICSNLQEFYITHVRNNSFLCSKCQQNKIYSEADNHGLIIIKEGRECHYKIYKFKECEHEQEISISDVRRNKFICRVCLQTKLENEALQNGLILIDNSKKINNKTYQFVQCGHLQEIQTNNVRINNFTCRTCKGIYLINGILVASRYEQIIGNYLIEQSIIFEYGKRLGEKTRHKTDYYLSKYDLYIEVAGMLRDTIRTNKRRKNYSERLKEKHKLYYENKNILYLLETDFYGTRWRDKLIKQFDILNNSY